MKLTIKVLPYEFSVCKLLDIRQINFDEEFSFFTKTDNEVSLVCLSENVPNNAIRREDGWKCLRVEGKLDFSVVGIIAKISSLLAENGITIFITCTFDTDYFFVRIENCEKAIKILEEAEYKLFV